MLFDTHAHLDDKRFNDDREQLIDSLQENNVSLVMNIGSDLENSFKSVELSKKYDFIYAAVGIHPHSAQQTNDIDLLKLEQLLDNDKVKAIGEIGLDYYYDNSPREKQKEILIKQLEIAKKHNVPIVIHDRDAHEDCYNIISAYNLPCVFHCYSGSIQYAERLLKLGYYISFTGVITFSNAKKLREVVSTVPIERIFIETDCPYLAPDPYRGSRNSPLYVHRVAETIAEIKGISYEDVCRITMENGKRFFRI